jgi:hypothetical protein
MQVHALKWFLSGRARNLLLCGALLAAAWVIPASADPLPVILGIGATRLVDNTDTVLGITNVGTTFLVCHHQDVVSDAGFTVCVGNNFAVGAFGSAGVNLTPASSGGPLHNGQPFFIPRPGADPIFLTETTLGSREYNLDAQPIGPNDALQPLPLGTLVQTIVENKPTNGQCIGVRTTIQHRKGTCKVWKIRKFYNTCSTNQTITQIREWDLPFQAATYAASAEPGGSRTAVALDQLGHYITLQTMGNTGPNPALAQRPSYQPSVAGSVQGCDSAVTDGTTIFPVFIPCDFLSCSANLVSAGEVGPAVRFMEVFLSFFPGGVTLKPAGKAGSEKLVTFCLDVE